MEMLVDISENEEQFVNLWYLVYLTFDIWLIRNIGKTQERLGGDQIFQCEKLDSLSWDTAAAETAA